MLRARQRRLWQGLRTKPHFTCFEDEDTARGVTGRRQRGKRLWSRHQLHVFPGEWPSYRSWRLQALTITK